MLEDLEPLREGVAPIEPEAPVAQRGFGLQLFAFVVAMLGGCFGIVGAFFQELQSGGGIFVAFTGAPIIEEALKPVGIILLLIRWPQALGGRLHIATLSAAAGVCFGLIESAIYTQVYFPD